MSHMVIFQTPDGNPGYNQFETLEEAVGFVERLRNDQSVETARIFALEEVKFEFRPYFRVEVASLGPAGSTSVATPPPAPPVADQVRPPVAPPHVAPPPVAPPPVAPPAVAPAPPVPQFGGPSPIGTEPVPVAPGAAPSAPTFLNGPAVAPPSDMPSAEPGTTRRGLFGR